MTKIEELEQEVLDANIRLLEAKERTYITCCHCKKRKQLRTAVLFQEQHYISPYS